MPFELHVANDLGLEQADGVARGGIAKAGQKFVGNGRAADSASGLQNRDPQPLLRQIISAGQTIVAGADDDRVVQISPWRISISASARALRPWSGEAQP